MKSADAYEDFVYSLLQRRCGLTVVNYRSAEWQGRVGENSGGIEIKFNKKYDETGNLWIEFYRKSTSSQADYTGSSLVKYQTCWLFVTGTYKTVFVFTKSRLEDERQKRNTLIENKSKTSQGFLLPGEDAERLAELVIYPTDADNVAAMTPKALA